MAGKCCGSQFKCNPLWQSCEIRGDAGDASDVNLNDTVTYFGSKDCQEGVDLPSIPEEEMELSYREECSANQLQVETRENNTWDKKNCPSECRTLKTNSKLVPYAIMVP